MSGGESAVSVEAQDLRSAIDQLDARFPGFKGRLLDEEGRPRQFVNLFLNDEDVRLGRGLESPLAQSDEIAIVPAVAGGLSLA